jgi:tetratricopeptide (TPR) repeat protein
VINWLTGQVNERNGQLDEAIASYEAVLSTKIPARGFDFGLDYEVLNALGSVSYGRARIAPLHSPEREAFLRKAIATYRRTLAIDSENVAAHYGLGLAYADPTWNTGASGVPGRSIAPARPEGGIEEELRAKAEETAEPAIPSALRAARALGLVETIDRFLEGGRPRSGSRLEPLLAVVERLGPTWESESDPAARLALGRALALAHKSLHMMFKPDETAAGRAVSIARRNDPAADQNAQSVVIHPLHRPGAPGIDPPTRIAAVPAPDSNTKESEE